VERDPSRRPGDHAFVRDFAGQDSDVATLLNHVQRTVGKAELRGDLRISLQKTADQARDNGLSQIHGRKQTQVAAQHRLIFAQALVRRFGVSQHGSCVLQQTLSRLRQIHPMGIAPQERRTAVLLQHAQVTAQRRLRNFQVARPGGDAAALHDANKGAEQGEVIECGHPISE
jgi:hypothetical protein